VSVFSNLVNSASCRFVSPGNEVIGFGVLPGRASTEPTCVIQNVLSPPVSGDLYVMCCAGRVTLSALEYYPIYSIMLDALMYASAETLLSCYPMSHLFVTSSYLFSSFKQQFLSNRKCSLRGDSWQSCHPQRSLQLRASAIR
jgi:hypothetical protein